MLEHEQTYKELMCMTGQKLQLQVLQGRTCGVEGPVGVEDSMRESKIRTTVTVQDQTRRRLNVTEAVVGGGTRGLHRQVGAGGGDRGTGGDGGGRGATSVSTGPCWCH